MRRRIKSDKNTGRFEAAPPPRGFREWAGHASIQTAWDIYGNFWREFKDEQSAARAAEQILLS